MAKRLAIIPARGGSKGIPHKNIVNLCGKPLIAYSIEAGLQAMKNGDIQKLIVSTDDSRIAEVARTYGAEVPFLRPAELAADTSKSVDFMLHAIFFYEEKDEIFDDVVLLQPTSPLRTGDDISNALRIYEKEHAESLVSCFEEESISEYNTYYLQGNKGMPLKKEHNQGKRRQEIPRLYARNGAIFITSVPYLKRAKLVIGDVPAVYVMDKMRSANIDTLFDLKMAEFILGESGNL